MDEWPGRIPDGIEPLVGYRMWVYALDGERAQLHPLSHFGLDPLPEWSPWACTGSSWVVASCPLGGLGDVHLAPDERCGCGFYAMATLARLIEMASFYGFGSDIVLGRIELAGKIIEHDHGYRAERARIDELIPIRGTQQTIRRIAFRLGLRMSESVVLLPGGFPPPASPPFRGSPPPASSIRLRVKEWLRAAAA